MTVETIEASVQPVVRTATKYVSHFETGKFYVDLYENDRLVAVSDAVSPAQARSLAYRFRKFGSLPR